MSYCQYITTLLQYYRYITLFYFYTFMQCKYPFSFLKLLEGTEINIALIRNNEIQTLYNQQPIEMRSRFINSIFSDDIDQSIQHQFIVAGFPYLVQYDIKHYVLWLRNGFNPDVNKLREIIHNYIVATFMESLEFTFCINNIRNRSILVLNHYHVFIKRNEQKNIITFDH
jgi:hypothetical protein